MPTYDYLCDSCGHEVEIFQSGNDKPKRSCPRCRSRKFRRLIGAGAGVIFKGSGFYGTDYRSKSYASEAKKDTGSDEKPASKKEAEPGGTPASKSDAKDD